MVSALGHGRRLLALLARLVTMLDRVGLDRPRAARSDSGTVPPPNCATYSLELGLGPRSRSVAAGARLRWPGSGRTVPGRDDTVTEAVAITAVLVALLVSAGVNMQQS